MSGDRPNSTVHLVRGGSTGGGGGARQEATAAISKLVESTVVSPASQAVEKRARKAIADGAEYRMKVAKLEYTEKCQGRLDRITDELAAGEVNGEHRERLLKRQAHFKKEIERAEADDE